MTYPQLKDHDPDGTRMRTIKVTLDSGDSLLNTTTLFPVTAAGAAISGGDLVVTIVSIGLIAASTAGDIWGVNFRITGGALRIGETPAPLICLRPYLASQPSTPAYDQTFRVAITQT